MKHIQLSVCVLFMAHYRRDICKDIFLVFEKTTEKNNEINCFKKYFGKAFVKSCLTHILFKIHSHKIQLQTFDGERGPSTKIICIIFK